MRDLVPFAQVKRREKTHGEVLLLVKLQAEAKVTVFHGHFSRFLKCKNGTKSSKASQIKNKV